MKFPNLFPSSPGRTSCSSEAVSCAGAGPGDGIRSSWPAAPPSSRLASPAWSGDERCRSSRSWCACATDEQIALVGKLLRFLALAFRYAPDREQGHSC